MESPYAKEEDEFKQKLVAANKLAFAHCHKISAYSTDHYSTGYYTGYAQTMKDIGELLGWRV